MGMRKFFALLCVLVLGFTIIGCMGQTRPHAGNAKKTQQENVEDYIEKTQPVVCKANSLTAAMTKKMLEAAAGGASLEQLEKLFIEISEQDTLPTLTEELQSLEKIAPHPDAREIHDARLKICRMNIAALKLRLAGLKEKNPVKLEQGAELTKQFRELNEQLTARINELTGKAPKAKKEALQLVEHKLQKNPIGYEVVGIARNITDKKISSAQIAVNAYDDKGNQVGNGLSNVTDLDPQEAWKFTICLTGREVSSYKIVALSWRD